MAGCATCGLARGTCGCSTGFSVNVAGNGPTNVPRPTIPTPLCGSLGQSLIKVVDGARNIWTQLGLRPYNVSLVRTRWTGGKRGAGYEEVVDVVPIVPTPNVQDLSQVDSVATSIGQDEAGDILVTEVSGAYTEDQLSGHTPSGQLLPKDEQCYWEIEYPPPCAGAPGEKRRFTLTAAPMYYGDKFQWQVRLTRQRVDRTRAGVPGGP